MHGGAAAALRGYRRQTLYALSRIIEARNDRVRFQLELHEDFAIVEPLDEPIEVVQVKDYSANLNFAVLEQFFFRAAERLRSNPGIENRVVSFGTLGPELERAWLKEGEERDSIRAKLSRPYKLAGEDVESELSGADIDSVFASVKIETVDEKDIKDRVFAFLQRTLAGGRPAHAFELLQFWLLGLSEEKATLTRDDLLKRLTEVGKYLRERESHYDEWFTAIKPLLEEPVNEDERGRLREDFYQGINARYSHILGDVDVVRPAKLLEIAEKFRSTNVVIIHGASGQGKSTLAYRFLHDFVPLPSRFEITAIEDLRHALTIARALSGHFESIGTEMYVYIDAHPGNIFWVHLVKAIVEYPNAKLLITIREEDFRRLDTPGTALGLPGTLELSLDKVEGQRIYDDLVERRAPEHLLSFEEAWERFGGKGPLLEFVYLITQNESLRERLGKQVQRLESEVRSGSLTSAELGLLRIVSSASAYGARLDLAKVVLELELTFPQASVERFEDEYLLRTSSDGRYVEGLHPLRSVILTELLTDPILQPWRDCVELVLKTAVEADLEAFLLFAFSRNHESEAHILENLSSARPQTWIGLAGVLNALLWLSTKRYVNQNREVIDKAFARFDRSWWMTVQVDLPNVWQGESWSWVESLANTGLVTDELLNETQELQSQFAAVDHVFDDVKHWLRQLSTDITPRNVFEWSSLATVCFWFGYLKVGSSFELVSDELLQEATERLDLSALSEVIFALSYSESFSAWYPSIRPTLIERFREETQTMTVEDDGEVLRSHFIIDIIDVNFELGDINNIDYKLSPLNEVLPDEGGGREGKAHKEAMKRVRLSRKLFPGRNTYGARGYGHRWALLELMHDESVKDVSTDYLLPEKATHINRLYNNLGDYEHRPETWKEYAIEQWEARQRVVRVFRMLQSATEGHFRKKNLVQMSSYLDYNAWSSCLQMLRNGPLIPKVAVDEWGYTSEPRQEGQDVSQARSVQTSLPDTFTFPVSLRSLVPLLESQKSLLNAVQNFLSQSTHVFKVNTFKARATELSPTERNRVVSESDLNPNLGGNSLLNLNDAYTTLPSYQSQFRLHFGQFFDANDLQRFEKIENETYKNIWCIWHQLVDHSNRRSQAPLQDARSRAVQARSRTIRSIEKELKTLSRKGVNAGLLKSDAKWEDKTTLWVSVDSEPLEVHDAIQAVLTALQISVGEVKYGSMMQVVLDQLCEHVCILPLVDGKLIAPSVRRISSQDLFIGTPLKRDAWWTNIFYPLPADLLRELKLEVWQDKRMDTVRRLSGLLANLCLVVAHLSDLNRFDAAELLNRADENDRAYVSARDLTQPWIEKKGHLVSRLLQGILDAEVELLSYHDSLRTTDSFLEEAKQVLVELHAKVLPRPNEENNEDYRLTLELAALPDWLVRLEQSAIHVEFLLLAWLEHVRGHPVRD